MPVLSVPLLLQRRQPKPTHQLPAVPVMGITWTPAEAPNPRPHAKPRTEPRMEAGTLWGREG